MEKKRSRRGIFFKTGKIVSSDKAANFKCLFLRFVCASAHTKLKGTRRWSGFKLMSYKIENSGLDFVKLK